MLQEKGYLYGWLAWALRGAGKAADACEAATDGVGWCEAHGLAYQEALCRIERAGALRESEAAATAERIERIERERAAVLIDTTSGCSLLPRLLEERARLTAIPSGLFR
jgi:hypothetical protein